MAFLWAVTWGLFIFWTQAPFQLAPLGQTARGHGEASMGQAGKGHLAPPLDPYCID